MLTRQARRHERTGDRTRPRNHLNAHAGVECGVNEPLAGVAHARHARIGDKGNALPRRKAPEHLLDLLGHDVLVTALQANVQAKRAHETTRHAGVLAEHHVGLAEHPPNARRRVLEVADRRANNAEQALHQTISARSKVASATRASQAASLPDVFQVLKNQAGHFS